MTAQTSPYNAADIAELIRISESALTRAEVALAPFFSIYRNNSVKAEPSASCERARLREKL